MVSRIVDNHSFSFMHITYLYYKCFYSGSVSICPRPISISLFLDPALTPSLSGILLSVLDLFC